MARRVGRARFVRPPPRSSVWIGINIENIAVGPGATVLVGVLNAAALALRPFTVTRTRGIIQWQSDQAAASEYSFGALGCIVVSDQAVAAGVASIPEPLLNTDAPFFVWEPFGDSFLFGDGTGFQGNALYTQPVDSKAMRKVQNNEDVAFTVENGSGFGAIFTMTARMLVKLH